MNLVDLMPLETWIEIEEAINRQLGLDDAVYDAEGIDWMTVDGVYL